jgi:hypothetical protein
LLKNCSKIAQKLLKNCSKIAQKLLASTKRDNKEPNNSTGGAFLTSPLGANFDPQWATLSPRGEVKNGPQGTVYILYRWFDVVSDIRLYAGSSQYEVKKFKI